MAVAIQRIQDACTSEKGRLETLRNNALYHELVMGMESVKAGDVYTIEEAWKELEEI